MISKFKITNIINQASIDRIKSIDNSSHFSVQKFMGNDTYLLEGDFILWNVENSTHHIALKNVYYTKNLEKYCINSISVSGESSEFVNTYNQEVSIKFVINNVNIKQDIEFKNTHSDNKDMKSICIGTNEIPLSLKSTFLNVIFEYIILNFNPITKNEFIPQSTEGETEDKRIKVAINGLKYFGGLALCQLINDKDIDLVAINTSLSDDQLLPYLNQINVDSNGNPINKDIEINNTRKIILNNKSIKLYNINQDGIYPWNKVDAGIDIVLDCSGQISSKEDANKIYSGSSKVIVVSPTINDTPFIVYGLNHLTLETRDERVITIGFNILNCISLLIYNLNKYAPIQVGEYSSSFNIDDTLSYLFPDLSGKVFSFNDFHYRPKFNEEKVVLKAVVKKIGDEKITKESINNAMKNAQTEAFGYRDDVEVSADVNGMYFASLFEASETKVSPIDESTCQVQVAAWFDSESSIISQIVRTIKYYARLNHI